MTVSRSARLKKLAAWRYSQTRAYVIGLTQQDFARRFGFSYGQALDIEQERSLPSLATRTLIEAVRLDPGLIERAAANARSYYGGALK